MTIKRTFLLAAGLLCGATLIGAAPLPVEPLLLGRLPMFDIKVAGSSVIGGGGGTTSAIGTANTVAKFTGVSTLGNSTITDTGTLATVNTASTFRATVDGSATQSFVNITGTLPSTLTGETHGVQVGITTAGTSAQYIKGLHLDLLAGYTGANATYGMDVWNYTSGTSTDWLNNAGNVAFSGSSFGNGNGATVSVQGSSNNTGAGDAIGVYGHSNSTHAGRNIAVAGISPSLVRNNAGYFALITSLQTVPDGALVANNGSGAIPIFIAQDNSTATPTTGPAATFVILDGAEAQAGNEVLTSGTMTAQIQANLRTVTHSYQWTNAMITALGAVLSGNVSVATLPAKTIVKNAYVVLNSTCAGTTTLTVSVGRTAATYVDYIVASNAQSGANTVYGTTSGTRGTNLTGYDLPSYTGTTVVNAQFISTVSNLSAVTTCTGTVILETALAP
jgi:hypothetical protein